MDEKARMLQVALDRINEALSQATDTSEDWVDEFDDLTLEEKQDVVNEALKQALAEWV